MKRVYVLLLISLSVLTLHATAQNRLLPDSLTHAPDSVKMWTLRNIGDSLAYASQYVSSKQAYQQALDIALVTGDQQSIGLGYRGLGFWYNLTGDYVQAINWYQKALRVFRENGNTRQFVKTLRFISNSYDRLQNYKQALNYTRQALAIAEKEKYTDLLMESYQGLAIYESKAKRYQQALGIYIKLLDYYKGAKDTLSVYQSQYNLALLYKNMGQYARSERVFKEVEAFGKQHSDTYFLGYVYLSIPYALIPQNKLDEAEQYCQLASDWIRRNGGETQTYWEEVNGHLTRLWEKRGNYQKALQFYRLQMANHDSLVNADKSRQVAELEARYQTREKEAEIIKLEEANAQQTRKIWVAVGGVILLTVLLATLYNLYERVRASRRKIQQQSDQLTLMMKEIHHRVKNNLAIVSSLLYLQTTTIDDDDVIQTMRIGQQRVEAMSLIHQRLYQTDQTTQVNMGDYLTDLVESLLKAYGYQLTNVDLQLQIDVATLDVDIAMPIGLIVNELVTNSLKYAYTFVLQPFLSVSLRQADGDTESDLLLEVKDNGPGIDQSDWERGASRSSFGKNLITLLSQQLDGEFELIKQEGTLFRLRIPYNRLLS
ncbi:tetratricopeptide repeat-containing sensor histidine kinase [Spirosoma terrae]|uniref:Tetratricopeptide repeat protein n=1 Tax=Spirosoma terrae TaxID=1968276 RepID=A0A6L9L1K9_9BACT|nr:histidine kinase dimerization/phosphoacceptor domain -containing protein [Spirosoma terrae]NDU94386.1 tetratricopeptide repeat protein [Spirosoma terrae]